MSKAAKLPEPKRVCWECGLRFRGNQQFHVFIRQHYGVRVHKQCAQALGLPITYKIGSAVKKKKGRRK